MRFGVVIFPGSNCDMDCVYVVRHVFHQPVREVWHQETSLDDLDAVIIPGGFSYGDYLRAGAIARFSPVMGAVRRFAESGRLVIGICNGFQILVEAGLLPGALMRNHHQRFVCKYVWLRTENAETPFTSRLRPGQRLYIPVAHGEGAYYADPDVLNRLRQGGQIVFRYVNPDGEVTDEANPNGSVENIAGICNEAGNVLGMMPHPERASEALLGSEDGRFIFASMLATAQ